MRRGVARIRRKYISIRIYTYAVHHLWVWEIAGVGGRHRKAFQMEGQGLGLFGLELGSKLGLFFFTIATYGPKNA